MYILQAAGYVIPFFTLPFLVRMLGTESYGLLALSQAVVMFLVMFVDSGFNESASRSIALHHDDPKKISEIYWSTQVVRVFLGLAGSVLMVGLIMAIPAWRAHWQVFAIQGLMLLGTISLPLWYFSGLERMKHVALHSIGARLIAAVAIFAMVRSPGDLLLAAACQAIATLIAGLGVNFVYLRYEIPWSKPSRRSMSETVRLGRSLFASEFVSGLASNSNVVLLGLFVSTEAAGVFSAIDKLMRAVKSLVYPIVTAFSPRVVRAYRTSTEGAMQLTRRLVYAILAASLSVALVLFFYAGSILQLLFGSQLVGYDEALRGMSAWLVLSCVNLAVLQFYFIAPGRFATVSRLLVTVVVIQLVLAASLTWLMGLHGIVLAAVLGELAMLVLAWREIRKPSGRRSEGFLAKQTAVTSVAAWEQPSMEVPRDGYAKALLDSTELSDSVALPDEATR